MKCDRCKNEIDNNSLMCKGCNKTFSLEEIDTIFKKETSEIKKDSIKSIAILIALFLAGVILSFVVVLFNIALASAMVFTRYGLIIILVMLWIKVDKNTKNSIIKINEEYMQIVSLSSSRVNTIAENDKIDTLINNYYDIKKKIKEAKIICVIFGILLFFVICNFGYESDIKRYGRDEFGFIMVGSFFYSFIITIIVEKIIFFFGLKPYKNKIKLNEKELFDIYIKADDNTKSYINEKYEFQYYVTKK